MNSKVEDLVLKVCTAFCEVHDGRVKNNHYSVRIYEDNGKINISMHGLGKAQGSDYCPIDWFMDRGSLCRNVYMDFENEWSFDAFKVSKEWKIWSYMYDLLALLGEEGIVVDEIEVNLECGYLARVSLETWD